MAIETQEEHQFPLPNLLCLPWERERERNAEAYAPAYCLGFIGIHMDLGLVGPGLNQVCQSSNSIQIRFVLIKFETD